MAGDGVVIHNYMTTFEALDHPSLSLARMANDAITATCNNKRTLEYRPCYIDIYMYINTSNTITFPATISIIISIICPNFKTFSTFLLGSVLYSWFQFLTLSAIMIHFVLQ